MVFVIISPVALPLIPYVMVAIIDLVMELSLLTIKLLINGTTYLLGILRGAVGSVYKKIKGLMTRKED